MDKDKLDIPYYKVAKYALINWNGLTQEEAIKFIQEESFETIEEKVNAKKSIDHAVECIKDLFLISEENKLALENFVYKGDEKSGVIEKIKEMCENSQSSDSFYKILLGDIITTLFAVHDGWVVDYKEKFMARDRKHQHMPSELIGWNEVKLDLIFVEPIFEALGVNVDEKSLEEIYKGKVKEFFLSKNILTSKDLAKLITQGADFYSPLACYDKDLDNIQNIEFVEQNIIPAIEEKGIGRIEDVRRNIVIAQVVENPEIHDIEKLTETEQKEVEDSIQQDINNLLTQENEMNEKNSVVNRIMDLVKRRKELKIEVEIEETQEMNDNLQSKND